MGSRSRTSSLLRQLGLTAVVLPPMLALPAAAMYREHHRPHLPQESYTLPDLTGKTIVATGSSSGIGKATVATLRELGATVVSGSRSEGNLDLSDLSSVKEFVQSIEKYGAGNDVVHVDIVLACAAEIYCDTKTKMNADTDTDTDTEEEETKSSNNTSVSVDGFDKTFATNHVGLQALLMEIEKQQFNNNNNNNNKMRMPSRVVIVGSKLEHQGLVDPEIIKREHGRRLNDRPDAHYTAVKHYSDTKLCNQLLATTLIERWPDTKVFSVSPGMVDTGLWRHFPLWFQLVTWPVRKVALRTSDDAALGVVYACASEEAGYAPSGSFFVDGSVETLTTSTESRDVVKARRLWQVVEELIGEAEERGK